MHKKLHDLWESHELLMEAVLLSSTLLLLAGLTLIPYRSERHASLLPSLPTQVSTVSETALPTGTLITDPNESSSDQSVDENARAYILQEIAKAHQEMRMLKDMSVSVAATIQKECGGQTNACAKNLQAALEANAEEYDATSLRLEALTASLGNLP